MSQIVNLIALVGRSALQFCSSIGRFTVFAAESISHLVRPPFYFREFLIAVMAIGYFSLPVVALTALFAGGALALQIYAGGSGLMRRLRCRLLSRSEWSGSLVLSSAV